MGAVTLGYKKQKRHLMYDGTETIYTERKWTIASSRRQFIPVALSSFGYIPQIYYRLLCDSWGCPAQVP